MRGMCLACDTLISVSVGMVPEEVPVNEVTDCLVKSTSLAGRSPRADKDS